MSKEEIKITVFFKTGERRVWSDVCNVDVSISECLLTFGFRGKDGVDASAYFGLKDIVGFSTNHVYRGMYQNHFNKVKK